MSEQPTLDFRNPIFPPPYDADIYGYLEQAEDIAKASLRSIAEIPKEWTAEEIREALDKAMGRMYRESDEDKEKFRKDAIGIGLPERPTFYKFTPVLQHGIGALSVDMLLVWNVPELFFRPKRGTNFGSAEEGVEGWEWRVESGEEGTLALLVNTPLANYDEDDAPPNLLGQTLRDLTTFWFNLKILQATGGFPIPDHLYVLCQEKHAKALSFGGFGAVVRSQAHWGEVAFTVMPPENVR